MAEKISFEPPRGMRDFYPEDMAWRSRVFDAFRAAGEAAGFRQYDACVVESYELLARKAGEEVGEQIYHFFDKSERHLALRAEMTPTLARMVAQRQKELPFPLKWTTIAQCFRYERMTKGRKREHYQWNLDIIGEDSVLAEAEVIGAACDALRRMGLSPADFKVHVSSRKFLGELLAKSGIAADRHAQVFLALDKRGKMPDAEIAAMLKDGGLSDAENEATFAIMETKDYSACPELVELFRLAEIAGFADCLEFDISVIRGLSYYTGVVFECFDTKGEFRAIFGGGRYDNLLTTIGGEPTSAVGLGFGDVVVTELLKARLGEDAAAARKGVAIGFMFPEQRDAAVALAARLRKSGECVDLALRSQKPKKFFSHAAESGAAKAVFLGPDDVEKGVARMKDLSTREETEMELVP
ncbi:MAG: histidine--tRNA ligase [Kiritimatiellae bacterium]|nr:histidine--tRNA ligase [Kiritimatiellia bacterium]MBR0241409.1 histidine--tRNA ligase [Kiritimatiellia bacterium]